MDQDLAEEMRLHLELKAQEKREAGLSEEEAHQAARLEFGNSMLLKEASREMWGGTSLESFLADLRFGFRMLTKNPAFAAVAMLTLALGIGVNTAIFSVFYGVLLRPLPYPKPSQIVELREADAGGNPMNFADPNFEDLRSQNHSLENIAEYGASLESISGGSEPSRTMLAEVSRDFFSILRVQPIRGRSFAAEDQRFGAPAVGLVSYDYWRQYLGGTGDLSSVKLQLGHQSCSIIGVLPPGFRFPSDSDIWVPRELFERLPSRTAHNWQVVARLREGYSLAQARTELSAIAQRLKNQYGQDTMMTAVWVAPLQDSLTHGTRPVLLILLAAAGFLLLVACANVVNLLYAQSSVREWELAIRAALGAGRMRLIRQFLTEALLLSFSGGVLGLLAAFGGVKILLAIAPENLPRLDDISINVPVFLFTLGMSALVAVGLGFFTAMRATSGTAHISLTERLRGRGGKPIGNRLSHIIVGMQIAISLLMLIGAGLLGRSLLQILSVDPGFRTNHVVAMDLALSFVSTEDEKVQRVRFISQLFAGLKTIPGVEEVGCANGLPLATRLSDGTYVVINPGQATPRMEDLEQLFHNSARTGDANYCVASEGFFHILGIPLRQGRIFDERDTMATQHVTLVSESLARQKWPNQNPLGRMIEFGNMDGDPRLLTIVGVVGDVRQNSLEAAPSPTIYVNYRQRPQATGNFNIVMRTNSDPNLILPAAREVLRNLNPMIPPRFRGFTQVYSAALRTRRFILVLVGVLGGTALLLAVAGLYGMMAYSVTQRTREIGVQIALGARAIDILKLILGQAVLTTVTGVACGIAGALALTRLMNSLLFGVKATDLATFAGVALLLSFVALLASYIPARKAMKVDPLVALRYE